MARSGDLRISPKVWTEITNGDVSTLTFQNKAEGRSILVSATVGSVAPTTVEGVEYLPSEGHYDISLATAFPGVPGANRVWVYSLDAKALITVFVSHA